MILAEHTGLPRQGVLMQSPRCAVFPQPVQLAGYVVRGLKGFWVILSEYLTPPGQGVLV